MNDVKRNGNVWMWMVIGLLFWCSLVQADVPKGEKWIDVEVVVNVLDGADALNVDDALQKANEPWDTSATSRQAPTRIVGLHGVG